MSIHTGRSTISIVVFQFPVNSNSMFTISVFSHSFPVFRVWGILTYSIYWDWWPRSSLKIGQRGFISCLPTYSRQQRWQKFPLTDSPNDDHPLWRTTIHDSTRVLTNPLASEALIWGLIAICIIFFTCQSIRHNACPARLLKLNFGDDIWRTTYD